MKIDLKKSKIVEDGVKILEARHQGQIIGWIDEFDDNTFSVILASTMHEFGVESMDSAIEMISIAASVSGFDPEMN